MSLTTNIVQDIFSFKGASQCFAHLKFYVKLKNKYFKKSYKIKNSTNENISARGCIEHNENLFIERFLGYSKYLCSPWYKNNENKKNP